MNKEDKVIEPKLRFPEFKGIGFWKTEPLGMLAKPLTDKVGEKKVTLMSITSGVGLVSQLEKFGREIAGSSQKNYILIKKGDFAYNKSSTKLYPEGEVALLEKQDEGAVPNSIFTCFRFCSKVIPQFAKHPFSYNIHGNWLRKFIAVGARANGALQVNNKDLFATPFPFPSPYEQQKIADCLSSLDELIQAETERLEALQAHKKGLMQQLFPAEGETVPKLRFPEFQDSGEWVETSLEQVAEYENGKAHEKDIDENGDYIVVNSKFISSEGDTVKYSDIAFCPANPGDILMVLSDVPNGKAIAKCFFVDEENRYSVNQRICRITATDCNSRLLFYIMDRNAYFLSFDDGVKQTNLRKSDVLEFPFRIPTDPIEQKKVASFISAVHELIIAQTETIESLKSHKKGLLHQLFPQLD